MEIREGVERGEREKREKGMGGSKLSGHGGWVGGVKDRQ